MGAKGTAGFHLDRIEAGGNFALETDDFGALLKVFDVSDNLVGGKFSATGTAIADNDARRYVGKAEATDQTRREADTVHDAAEGLAEKRNVHGLMRSKSPSPSGTSTAASSSSDR